MASVKVKRVYEDVEEGEGQRVFVERLWPRGISRQDERVGYWLKEIAPTDELRRWFHETGDFANFSEKYRRELAEREESRRTLDELRSLLCEHGTITLVYASRDEEHNSAVVLKSILEEGR